MCVCGHLAMEFHDKLKPMAVKEGLKGRKVTRAVESFSWNITILKVNIHTPDQRLPQNIASLFRHWPTQTNSSLSSYPSPSLFQGQADLLKRAKTEVQENIKQVHYAALTSNLSKGGTGETTHTRRSLDALPSMSGTAPARSFP